MTEKVRIGGQPEFVVNSLFFKITKKFPMLNKNQYRLFSTRLHAYPLINNQRTAIRVQVTKLPRIYVHD